MRSSTEPGRARRATEAAHARARIFWVDGLGALLVGLFVLALREPLAGLYTIDPTLLTVLGAVNVAYAPLGLTLAMKRTRPVGAIVALALANAAWALVCAVLLVRLAGTAGPLALVHVGVEGAYVAVLAALEWRHRHRLVHREPMGSP